MCIFVQTYFYHKVNRRWYIDYQYYLVKRLRVLLACYVNFFDTIVVINRKVLSLWKIDYG